MRRGQSSRYKLLRILRIAGELKLSEVACKVPCDVATLSRHERGAVRESDDLAVRTIEVLGGEAAFVGLIAYLQSALERWRARQQPPRLGLA